MVDKVKQEWLLTDEELRHKVIGQLHLIPLFKDVILTQLSKAEPLIRQDERERIAVEVDLINDTAISTTQYRVMLERLIKSLKGGGAEWFVMIFLAVSLLYFYGAALYYHKKYTELKEEGKAKNCHEQG